MKPVNGIPGVGGARSEKFSEDLGKTLTAGACGCKLCGADGALQEERSAFHIELPQVREREAGCWRQPVVFGHDVARRSVVVRALSHS
jgi:hypothetical protein